MRDKVRSKLKKRKANDDDDDGDETKRKEQSAMRLVNSNCILFIDPTWKIWTFKREKYLWTDSNTHKLGTFLMDTNVLDLIQQGHI